MSDSATTQLYQHVQKLASIHKQPIPKLNYEFHYSEVEDGFQAELTLFGRTYRTPQFFRKKKAAKEAASAMALSDSSLVLIPPMPSLSEAKPLNTVDPSIAAWQTFSQEQQQQDNTFSVAPATTGQPTAHAAAANEQTRRVARVHGWLDHSLRNHHGKSYVSLLTELTQVLAIEPARFAIDQAYYAIGGRTHAPYTATVFVGHHVFTTPEPQETIQAAKDYCAYYAIVALVYEVCGVSMEQPTFPLSSDGRGLPRPMTMTAAPPPSALPVSVLTPGPPSLPPRTQHKRPIISAFNSSETGMLNELTVKLQWAMPVYEIDCATDQQTNATIFRCTVILRTTTDNNDSDSEANTHVIRSTQWFHSKKHAKHCAAAQALDQLSRQGLCVVVRD